jgi:hypothetical protein
LLGLGLGQSNNILPHRGKNLCIVVQLLVG